MRASVSVQRRLGLPFRQFPSCPPTLFGEFPDLAIVIVTTRVLQLTRSQAAIDHFCSTADLISFRSCRMAFLATPLNSNPIGIDINLATIL